MTFDEFWQAIAKRNGWTDETKLEFKAGSLKKLCKQAVDMVNAPPKQSVLDDIFDDLRPKR